MASRKKGVPSLPAYFVIRGSTLRAASLDMRLDLFRSTAAVNSCLVRVGRKSDGKDSVRGVVPFSARRK